MKNFFSEMGDTRLFMSVKVNSYNIYAVSLHSGTRVVQPVQFKLVVAATFSAVN